MKRIEGLEVSYGDVFQRFEKHFELEHNNNVLFSGKYGIGKTTFLKSFFAERNNVQLIRISPVNYAVSSNESVFELIKADIIRQLFYQQQVMFDDNEPLNQSESAQGYFYFQRLQVAKHLVRYFLKLDPIGEASIDLFDSVREDILKYQESLNAAAISSDQKMLSQLELWGAKTGSFLEFNEVSRMIRDKIQKIKEEGKQIVLLIDDLDRLDPEHIFRILNVFSSHHDIETNEHKFGIDKVIIACDLDNIEKIYHHRFGPETDFNGYLDKFYSDEVFQFSNNDGIEFFLNEEFITNVDKGTLIALRVVLAYAVQNGFISMRNLRKYKHFKRPESFRINEVRIAPNSKLAALLQAPHIRSGVLFTSSDDVQIIYLFRYLSQVLGEFDSIIPIFKSMVHHEQKLELTKEARLSLIESLTLAVKVVQVETPVQTYFNEVKFSKSSNRYSLNPGYPHVKFFNENMNVRLIPSWNAGNQYSGDQSFFYRHSIDVLSNENESWTTVTLATQLIHLHDYLVKQQYKSRLGIVS